jgi:hypothetical protein
MTLLDDILMRWSVPVDSLDDPVAAFRAVNADR